MVLCWSDIRSSSLSVLTCKFKLAALLCILHPSRFPCASTACSGLRLDLPAMPNKIVGMVVETGEVEGEEHIVYTDKNLGSNSTCVRFFQCQVRGYLMEEVQNFA